MRLSFRIAAIAACVISLAACSLESSAPPPARSEPSRTQRGAPRVNLLVFPDDDEQELIDAIGNARQRVYMTMYLLTDARIIDALKAASDNGVDVKVLLEINPLGAGASAKTAFDKLKAGGVAIKTANPTFRLTHQKSFVIDDRVLILTANMTRSSFTRNREFAVWHSTRADVDEIARAFDADWKRDSFQPASEVLVWSPVNARERINALIENARATLNIYAASALDDQQIGLIAAAQQRGVAVRLLTSPPRASEDSDADAEDLDILQRARVSVRFLKSPIVHAKAFVADGSDTDRLAFVGSVNITTQSMNFNRELGILIADAQAIDRLSNTFQADWDKAVDR